MRLNVEMKNLVLCVLFFVGSICSERRRRTRLLSSEGRDSICTEKRGYYPMVGQCDAYFECQNWKATVKFCPDGLLFKTGTPYLQFPCLYPVDVSCEGRPMVQVAKPTLDCPNQYGFFPGDDPKDCGLYKNCVDGRAYHLRCPEGLAYNMDSLQCTWPDTVKSCDVESYLGFACPGLYNEDVTSTVTVNYAHPNDCRKFYSCVGGKPRVMSCDKNKAFDEDSGICKREEDVFCVLV